MKDQKPILATDLDGTLIPSQPMEIASIEYRALEQLAERAERGEVEIVFVTGRHYESVRNAIDQYGLPSPKWIICNVGSSIYHREQGEYQVLSEYDDHLHQITGNVPPSKLALDFNHIVGLRLQEPEKQSVNKLSFYCEADQVEERVLSIQSVLLERQLPHTVVSSLDPFNGDGLIDVMPAGVNKASALLWWSQWREIDHQQIVFAGDSGNDYEALTAAFKGILVGNAEPSLVKRIEHHHRQRNSSHRIYLARNRFTAGVLEGCEYYGLFKVGK